MLVHEIFTASTLYCAISEKKKIPRNTEDTEIWNWNSLRNENAWNSVASHSAEDKKNSEFRSEPFREDKELGIPFRTILQNKKTLRTS